MGSKEKLVIYLRDEDTVATAMEELQPGDVVEIGDESITIEDPIPYGHKFATSEMKPEEFVIKYGAPIGKVTSPISRGKHVDIHNIADIVQEVRAKVF